MDQMTASHDDLWQLWWLLRDALVEYLKTTPPERRRASMLEVVRAFLHDNNVSATTLSASESLEALEALEAPFPIEH